MAIVGTGIFLAVNTAILETGIDQAEIHRHDLGAKRFEGHLIDVVGYDPDLQALEVSRRTNGPP